MTTTYVDPLLESADQLAAWLQDQALGIWQRALNPTSEIPIWAAYYALRGKQQTILNFYANAASQSGPAHYPADLDQSVHDFLHADDQAWPDLLKSVAKGDRR